MDNKYIDVVPDQPIAEGYNSEERELDVPDFPQGEQKVKTVKVEVEDIESGEKVAKKLGEYQGELSPNPGYGEDGETKDATKIHLVEESIPADGGKFVDQNGIRVEREPVNYVGGLYVKGKPVNPEEGSGGSGTKLYKHIIYMYSENANFDHDVYIITTVSQPITLNPESEINLSLGQELISGGLDSSFSVAISSFEIDTDNTFIIGYVNSESRVEGTIDALSDVVTEL